MVRGSCEGGLADAPAAPHRKPRRATGAPPSGRRRSVPHGAPNPGRQAGDVSNPGADAHRLRVAGAIDAAGLTMADEEVTVHGTKDRAQTDDRSDFSSE